MLDIGGLGIDGGHSVRSHLGHPSLSSGIGVIHIVHTQVVAVRKLKLTAATATAQPFVYGREGGEIWRCGEFLLFCVFAMGSEETEPFHVLHLQQF